MNPAMNPNVRLQASQRHLAARTQRHTPGRQWKAWVPGGSGKRTHVDKKEGPSWQAIFRKKTFKRLYQSAVDPKQHKNREMGATVVPEERATDSDFGSPKERELQWGPGIGRPNQDTQHPKSNNFISKLYFPRTPSAAAVWDPMEVFDPFFFVLSKTSAPRC